MLDKQNMMDEWYNHMSAEKDSTILMYISALPRAIRYYKKTTMLVNSCPNIKEPYTFI